MKYLKKLSDRLGSGVLPLILCAVALAGTLIFSSCKKEAQFKIEGMVEGGADKTIALEKADFHGYWYPVDSVKVNADGKFSVKAEAPSSPEIYRLVLGGRYIYLPVDSIETLTVTGCRFRLKVQRRRHGTGIEYGSVRNRADGARHEQCAGCQRLQTRHLYEISSECRRLHP